MYNSMLDVSPGDVYLDYVQMDNESKNGVDEWIEKANLPISTYYNSACSCGDMIYIFGGHSSSYSKYVYEYHPKTNKYVKKGTAPVSLQSCSAVELFGDIYVLAVDAFYKYNPSSDTWVKLMSPVVVKSRQGSVFVEYNGDLYSFGATSATASVEKYNVLDETWIRLSDMPYAVGYASGDIIGDKCYIIGGSSSTGTYLIYDFKTDTYTKYDNPLSLYHHRCAKVGDTLYSVGGYDNLKKIYEIKGTTWTLKKDPPVGLDMFAMCEFENDLYCFGGNNSNSNRTFCYKSGYTVPTTTTTFYLYEIDGELYTEIDNKLSKLQNVTISETTIIEHGVQSYNADILASNDNIKLYLYEQNPAVIGYNFNYTSLHIGQKVVQDYDFGASSVNKLTISGKINVNDVIRVLFSNDSGKTWYTFSNTTNEPMLSSLDTIENDGLTHLQVNALTSTELTKLVNGTDKLRLALYMKQAKSTAILKVDHIRLEYKQ